MVPRECRSRRAAWTGGPSRRLSARFTLFGRLPPGRVAGTAAGLPRGRPARAPWRHAARRGRPGAFSLFEGGLSRWHIERRFRIFRFRSFCCIFLYYLQEKAKYTHFSGFRVVYRLGSFKCRNGAFGVQNRGWHQSVTTGNCLGNYRAWDIDWRSPQAKQDLPTSRSRGERAQNEERGTTRLGAGRSGARESARKPRSIQFISNAADTSCAAPSPHLSLPHTPQTRAHASRAARTVIREPDPRRSRS